MSRTFPAIVSLVAGLAIFLAKLAAWHWTGSTAVLSDALESIVNVVAAAFAIFSVRFAAQPADRAHPYGHGKVEHLSAAFEGGLVAFAAVAILVTSVGALITGVELRSLDLGLVIIAGAGVANLVLGTWLVAQGRRLGSPALLADGQHVLSDVWTTLGVLAGLGLVWLTGLSWLDPLVALLVGLVLVRTGVGLVKDAVHDLLDAEDPELATKLTQAFEDAAIPGVIGLHKLRTIRGGAELHVDAHAHVPEFWTVEQSHAVLEELEQRMLAAAGGEGELALHLDPCLARRSLEASEVVKLVELDECPDP